MFKFVLMFLMVIILGFAASNPQFGHGQPKGPSNRFEHTKNYAAPPVDLSLPPVFLPESIPIHENVKE